MFGFGKKKNEISEIVEKKTPSLDRRSRKQLDREIEDLKDLKSKNKNKRKEPPKPWGRSERVIVLSLAFGTAAVAGLLGLNSRSWKMPGLPRVNFQKLNFEETYVLEADEKKDPQTEHLKQSFADETRSLSGVYGFYVARLFQDESYGFLQDEPFPAGTAMRLPLAIVFYIEAEDGNLRIEPHKNLLARVISGEQGAYDEALGIIGLQKAQQIIEEIGMSNTSFKDGLTTPADLGKLLRKLWDNRLLNGANSQEIIALLSNESSEASSLIGTSEHAFTQATIEYSNIQPLVLVIMSKGVVDSEAKTILPRLSEMIYKGEK